jgi:hypothetical protein
MLEDNIIESVSLEIANYWTSNGFLTETNKNCGTLVAFDWIEEEGEYYLTEINTNIDLGDLEVDNFKFDIFVEFLKKNNFDFVLGLRNNEFFHNPSVIWTDKFKDILKSNEMEYDEYIVDRYPSPIPEFDVPDNIFILRYSYDEFSKIDGFASNQFLFEEFIKKSDWEEYYKEIEDGDRMRVIVFCSDIENFVLKEGF